MRCFVRSLSLAGVVPVLRPVSFVRFTLAPSSVERAKFFLDGPTRRELVSAVAFAAVAFGVFALPLVVAALPLALIGAVAR